MIKKALLALLPLATLAGGWYFVQSKNTDIPQVVKQDSGLQNSDNAIAEKPSVSKENPLATTKDNATLIVESINTDSVNVSLSETGKPNSTIVESAPATTTTNIDPSSIAIEPLTDAEFIRLEQQIKNDKQLRLSLLEEFRYNTDPVRAQQLTALLGPYDDPEILQVASELVYSGDPQSRIAGLDLLSRIQPRNNEARNIAIDLLSSGDNAKMLVATMNVLATPSADTTDSQQQTLNDNLNNLSNHYDATVRAQSISLLGRWDKNSAVARDAFSRGLSDPDPNVRSTATFAINNISNPDDNMISGLLYIAENTDEDRSTRYAALRALETMQLSNIQQRRYTIAKRSANRR